MDEKGERVGGGDGQRKWRRAKAADRLWGNVLSTLFCLYLSTYFVSISHQIRQEMDEEDKHVTVEQSR